MRKGGWRWVRGTGIDRPHVMSPVHQSFFLPPLPPNRTTHAQVKLEAEETRFRQQSRALDEEVELTSAAYVPVSQSHARLMLPTQGEVEAARARRASGVDSDEEEGLGNEDGALSAASRTPDDAEDPSDVGEAPETEDDIGSLAEPQTPRKAHRIGLAETQPFTPPMLRKLAQVCCCFWRWR
jgi:hypothetical protein